MHELKKQIEATLKKLNQYPHQGDFDLYDLEELIFREFQEVQRAALGVLTQKELGLKKTPEVAPVVVRSQKGKKCAQGSWLPVSVR